MEAGPTSHSLPKAAMEAGNPLSDATKGGGGSSRRRRCRRCLLEASKCLGGNREAPSLKGTRRVPDVCSQSHYSLHTESAIVASLIDARGHLPQ